MSTGDPELDTILAVQDWFENKMGKDQKWIRLWWVRETPLLDGKYPAEVLHEKNYELVLAFARNDRAMISTRSR